MAIGDALKAKEHTYQELIHIYQKMYDDLRIALFPAETGTI